MRTRLALVAVAALRLLVRPLGWRGGQRVGALLGRALWPLLRRERRRTLAHLAIAFPALDAGARRRLGRDSFAHFGAMLLECLRMLGEGCAELTPRVDFEGWEHVEALRARGRGILLVTGHCGNWELLGAMVSCRGVPLSVVAREAQEAELDAIVVHLRARYGTRTITRGSGAAARELLRATRDGAALGMLIDQDTRVEGVFVPFFGRAAWTPVGAAQLALRRGLAVLPIFAERRADGRHLVRVLPPLELGDDAQEATARMTLAIEQQVRRAPAQWVWMHRRWRRRPADEATTG